MSVLSKIRSKYSGLSTTVKAGIWFTICNFLQKGISFITVPIFTRIMSTEEYGIFSVYTSWYSILTIFATLNLSYFVFNKGMVKYAEDRDKFQSSIQSLSLIVTIAFTVIYLSFRRAINEFVGMSTAIMLCMLLQILFEPPILYWTSRNRFEYKYKDVVSVTLAISLLNPILGIVLVKVFPDDSASLARAISLTIVAVLFGGYFFVSTCKRSKVLVSTKYWKYALAFNVPLIPHFLSQSILNQSDRIMIKEICNASDAAIYSVAYSVGMAILIFSQAIQQTYLPWLYQKLAKKDYKGIKETNSLFLIIMGILCLLVICFSPEIIHIVGSEKYMAAVWAMPPICGSVYFIFLQNQFANIEYYFEKTKLIAAASVFIALLNVMLNYIFINMYGFIAAGYTTLFCYAAHAVIHYIVMIFICKKNNLKIDSIFSIREVTLTSIAFLAAIAMMLIVYKSMVIRYSLIAIILVTMFIYRDKVLSAFRIIRSK